MPTQDAKTIARRTMELLDMRDLDVVIEQYSSGAKFHGFAPETLDVEGYRQTMSMFLSAFPDSRFPVDDWIAEEDKVVNRHSLRGTHQGELMGIPATGKQVRVDAIVIFHVIGGKIAEVWLNADFMGLMQQLGAVPQAGSPVGK